MIDSVCRGCKNLTTDCVDAMEKDRKHADTLYLRCGNYESSHVVHCAACVNYIDEECDGKIRTEKGHYPEDVAGNCQRYVESVIKCGMCDYFEFDDETGGNGARGLGYCPILDEYLWDFSAPRCPTHGAVRESESHYHEYQANLAGWCV